MVRDLQEAKNNDNSSESQLALLCARQQNKCVIGITSPSEGKQNEKVGFSLLSTKHHSHAHNPPVSSQKQHQGDGLTTTISPRGWALSSQNMFVDFAELSP